MSAEEMKALVRKVVESGLSGDLSILEAHPGLQEIIEGIRQATADYSDIKVSFPLQFVGGDWVATRAVMDATYNGSRFGEAVQGKRVNYEVLMLHQIQDGTIVKQHSQIDLPSLMGQLGLAPQPVGGE